MDHAQDELDSYRWLATAAAAEPLAQAAEHRGELAALIERLRRWLTPTQAQRVTQQLELRRRAAVKFSRAERMLFASKLLEQATDEWLAAYKAARFPEGATVADLCCGCGGDLLALASRGPVIGVDRDPLAVILATHNLRACGLAGEVRLADAAEHLSAPWAHIDPDRRAAGTRITAWELCEPGPDLLKLLRGSTRGLAVKLAPATEPPVDWQETAERQWLGSRGECRQQVLWCGELAQARGLRTACVVEPSMAAGDRSEPIRVATLVETPAAEAAPAARLGRRLWEPHAAVRAAGLSVSLAAQHQWRLAAPQGGYLTSDDADEVDNPEAPGGATDTASLATPFDVLDVVPFDLRAVRRMLAAHQVVSLEVKRRGIPDTPEQILKRLRHKSGQQSTLIVTRLDHGVFAALCRRAGRPT